LVTLPYAEDTRDGWRGGVTPPETIHDLPQLQKSVELAHHMMRKLAIRDFDCCNYSNPAIQRYYAGLQALALDNDMELSESGNPLQCDEAGMVARAGEEIDAFCAATMGREFDVEAAVAEYSLTAAEREKRDKEQARKRKREEDVAVARSKLEKEGVEVQMEVGELDGCNVKVLGWLCSAHGLATSGTKKARVERLGAHMGDCKCEG